MTSVAVGRAEFFEELGLFARRIFEARSQTVATSVTVITANWDPLSSMCAALLSGEKAP